MAVKTVLVVEDDDNLRQLVCTVLDSPGLSIVGAADGIEAVNLISSRQFDLVLLDLGLPGMNGLEIMERIRKVSSPPRVIVMTGDGAPETVLTAVRRQAYRYILKPFRTKNLVEVVNDALVAKPAPPPIEVLSALPEWVELSLPCDLESAERIQEFMEHLEADLPHHVREATGRAFRELLLNAIEWGGNLDPGSRVRISCLRARRMLLYRIADPGPGFSMDKLKHAALSNSDENPLEHMETRSGMGLRPGGFGILLVKSIVDELIYNESKNEVVFVKYLD